MAEAPPAAADLFENAACALVVTRQDGRIERANVTACRWFGYAEEELAGKVCMRDLLPVGGRLFYHTHCQPILEMRGSVAEVTVDLCNRGGERLPMLINIVRHRHDGTFTDHWALFRAADRRAYERELLAARRAAEAALEARLAAETRLQQVNAQLLAADHR